MRKTIVLLSVVLTLTSQINAQNVLLLCRGKSNLYSDCHTSELIGQINIGTKVNKIETICKDNLFDWPMIKIETLDSLQMIGWAKAEDFIDSASAYMDSISKKKLTDYYESLWGKENYQKIQRHLYWIGMTSQMARASIGNPDDVKSTVGSWGTNEQWVYKKRNLYLYFENGVLTGYQN